MQDFFCCVYNYIEGLVIANKFILLELFIITNLLLIGFISLKTIGINISINLNWKSYLFWIIGAFSTFVILIYVKILNNNHQSIVLVAFAWSKLFINLHKKMDSDAQKPTEELSKLNEFVIDLDK